MPPPPPGMMPHRAMMGPPGMDPNLPDYLRMSRSKVTTGWSASPHEAAAGPLSAFTDVWRQRQNGGGPGQPHVRSPPDPAQQQRRQAAQSAFEGMSLAEVLASAPKKEAPPFARKGPAGAAAAGSDGHAAPAGGGVDGAKGQNTGNGDGAKSNAPPPSG